MDAFLRTQEPHTRLSTCLPNLGTVALAKIVLSLRSLGYGAACDRGGKITAMTRTTSLPAAGLAKESVQEIGNLFYPN